MKARPIAVLGAGGRIGHLISTVRTDQLSALPITRGQDPVGLGQPGEALPIVVCTRNDDLPGVLAQVHPSRHADLVFVQNGMLRPWLAEGGLSANTQGVLWVAVTHKGDAPIPGGLSVFSGPWAEDVAALFRAAGVTAAAVPPAVLAREIAVKLAWICVYGALGSATGAKVGVLATTHADRVRVLSDELLPLLRVEPGLDLDADGLFARLQAYSAGIPDFPASVKEWPWRNGWQLDLAARLGRPQPALRAALQQAGISADTGP